MVLGMSLECILLHNSCVVTNSDTSLIQNQLWTTAKCAVYTSVANNRSRRLLQYHASCREGIAVLVCQLAVGICAEEAVGEFSCGYVSMQEVLRCSHKVPG